MSRRNVPGIPAPLLNMVSLQQTAAALKERVDVMSGERGDIRDRAVTLGDLVTLGLITESKFAEIVRLERKPR